MNCPKCRFALSNLTREGSVLECYGCPICGALFITGVYSDAFKGSGRQLRLPPMYLPSIAECPKCYTQMYHAGAQDVKLLLCPSCSSIYFEKSGIPSPEAGKNIYETILDLIAPMNNLREQKRRFIINPMLEGRVSSDLYGIRFQQ